jgi:hypothetical protein
MFMPNHSLRLAGGALLAATLLLSGCGDHAGSVETPSPAISETPVTPAPSAALPSDSASPSDSENQLLVDTFIQKASSNPPSDELMKELSKSVSAASPEQDDQMLRAMDEYYTRNLPETEKKFQTEDVQKALSQLKYPVTQDQIDNLKDGDVKDLVNQSLAGGYKLDMAEGMVFPIVDYAKLQTVADGASPAMKTYLALMSLESEKVMQKDAAIIIGRDEVLQRTLLAEAYTREYKGTPERKKVKIQYVHYIWAYLLGLDNTPTYAEEFRLDPKVKADLEKTVKEHPGTVTAKLTEKFLGILEKTGGKMFKKDADGNQASIPEVQTFIDGIEQEALKALDS